MLRIAKWIRITPAGVTTDAGPLFAERRPEEDLLVHAYRAAVNDYPKFFKMDGLSRLGFIASELLLRDTERRFEPTESRAVMLFSRGGSVCNDRHYQETIADPANFYPSPAIFVYTLPNIVTGEIAIRNRFYGETSCYLLDAWDAAPVVQTVESTFAADPMIADALCGWVDYLDRTHFEATLLLVERGGAVEHEPFCEPALNRLQEQRNETNTK